MAMGDHGSLLIVTPGGDVVTVEPAAQTTHGQGYGACSQDFRVEPYVCRGIRV